MKTFVCVLLCCLFLTNCKAQNSDFKSYFWDYENKILEEGALDNTYIFIHLAGAPISKRWTESYKKEIYNSRINSAQFIYEEMQKKGDDGAIALKTRARSAPGQHLIPGGADDNR